MFFFLIVSLLATPLYVIYNLQGGYDNSKVFERWSIGNLGFSRAYCFTTAIETQFLTISCESGVITNRYDFGVIPRGTLNSDAKCVYDAG